MKIRVAHIAWLLLLAVAGFGGCKSVATTSAILHNQNGRYDLAIESAREGLRQNPNDAEAYFQLGVSYSNLDSVALAYKNFMKSLELEPNDEKRKELVNNNVKHNYSKHYNTGQAAFQDREYQAAAQEFILATEADPRQSVAYYNLGVAYTWLAGEDPTYHEKAIEALEMSLEKATPDQSHYIDALGLVGKELAEVGRVEDAIARFNRLVEEDPANYAVIENLGIERFNAQDWRSSETFLKMAAQARVKVGAEDFKLYYDLGRVCYFLFMQIIKDPDGAGREDPEAINALRRSIEYYEHALDLEPDEPQTILNLIIDYMEMEDWSNAISWGEKYVSLMPDSEEGWQVLSISYTKYGDKEKATQCAERYAEIMARKNQGQ